MSLFPTGHVEQTFTVERKPSRGCVSLVRAIAYFSICKAA